MKSSHVSERSSVLLCDDAIDGDRCAAQLPYNSDNLAHHSQFTPPDTTQLDGRVESRVGVGRCELAIKVLSHRIRRGAARHGATRRRMRCRTVPRGAGSGVNEPYTRRKSTERDGRTDEGPALMYGYCPDKLTQLITIRANHDVE